MRSKTKHRIHMKSLKLYLIPVLLLLVLCHRNEAKAVERMKPSRKTYMIHMDKSHMPEEFDHHLQWYDSVLKSVSGTASKLYTYNHVIDGFSTSLTAEEAELLGNQPGVLFVLPEVKYKLHTTRTPEFLGLGHATSSLLPTSGSGDDVIVGFLDSGVWPELKSFDDSALGPVPDTWKGVCVTARGFNASSCNKKLIGARFFSKGYEEADGPIDETVESKSPRDTEGHGTHTSTTVAGTAVANASMFGYASGTARGMAPQARVAMYKVCWLGGCYGSDILAAMDKAVEDGVDILSISLGGGTVDLYSDPIAIGAFTAAAKGIMVSCSAGNEGPQPQSLINTAPWITTVGAGTLDRDFPTVISLGNGQNYTGISLYSGKIISKPLELVRTGDGSVGRDCIDATIDPYYVAGSIVMCDYWVGEGERVQKGELVKEAGGAGMILADVDFDGNDVIADAHVLPSAFVGKKAGDAIKSYMESSKTPAAKIGQPMTRLGVQPAPIVPGFSSRGPNTLAPELLKPDIIAPGVNILAGWTGKAGPSGLWNDTRHVNFNIISGTSMSCPHVSGLAALVKTAHPEWSPAAIRSALMTTAYTTYKDGTGILDAATRKPATPFDFGAGHASVASALDPGLVYDTSVDDYLRFLCALKYTRNQIKRAANRDFTCSGTETFADFNYPSFSVVFEEDFSNGGNGFSSTYNRTLTNVGTPGTYTVSVSSQTKAVKISVEPTSLSFSSRREKKSYTVTFIASSTPQHTTSFARIEWSDGKHTVGSPIAITWK